MSCSKEVAAHFTAALRYEFGIFCRVLVYPVVPKGVMILRLIAGTLHEPKDITQILEAFSILAERFPINAVPEQFESK